MILLRIEKILHNINLINIAFQATESRCECVNSLEALAGIICTNGADFFYRHTPGLREFKNKEN